MRESNKALQNYVARRAESECERCLEKLEYDET